MTRIRQAIPHDLPQIITLDQEIFGVYGADEPPEVIGARLEAFPSGCVVLEEVEKTANTGVILLGYLTTEKWTEAREPMLDEDPHITHQPNGQVLCITTLAIAPQAQNRGLGLQLLNQAISIAQREQCNQIILETAHAKKFYHRHNFEVVGERTQRGIPLYIMQKLIIL